MKNVKKEVLQYTDVIRNKQFNSQQCPKCIDLLMFLLSLLFMLLLNSCEFHKTWQLLQYINESVICNVFVIY